MVDDRGMGNCGFSDQLRFAPGSRWLSKLVKPPHCGDTPPEKVLSVPNDTTKAYAEVTANNPDRGAIGVLNENCSHDICKEPKELK